MTDPKAHVALLVDVDALALAAPALAVPEAAQALLRYASGVGRVTLSRAYADWTKRPAEEARAVQGARVVPVLVPAGPAGEDRSHVRLVVDALEALFAGGEPDAFVVASGDARLLPLVQALRADGSDVLLVVPAVPAAAGSPADDVRAEADVVVTLEEVLAGAVGRPSEPRNDREEEAEPEAPPPRAARPERRFSEPPRAGAWGRQDEGPRGGGFARAAAPRGSRDRFAARAPAPLDLENYDWAGFVKLIDELEHRLPFVGVRYLVNKVLGPRNCGIDDPRQKRDLINRAVDEGILEMYEVGNVEDRRDPVTACRLDRKNPLVVSVLGAETSTPVVAEAKEGEEGAEASDQEAEAATERSERDDAD